MALFQLNYYCLVKMVGFCSISSEGMHLFYQKFAEGYIIVKYRSRAILIAIHKLLAELLPFFNLDFAVGLLS